MPLTPAGPSTGGPISGRRSESRERVGPFHSLRIEVVRLGELIGEEDSLSLQLSDPDLESID